MAHQELASVLVYSWEVTSAEPPSAELAFVVLVELASVGLAFEEEALAYPSVVP